MALFGPCTHVSSGTTANTDVSNAVREGKHWYLYLPVDDDYPIGFPLPRLHVCGLVAGEGRSEAPRATTIWGGQYGDEPFLYM